MHPGNLQRFITIVAIAVIPHACLPSSFTSKI